MGYQKKHKTMVYPMILTAAVKFYHGDQQDDNGFSLFVWDISRKKIGDIVLEIVVENIFSSGVLAPTPLEKRDH